MTNKTLGFLKILKSELNELTRIGSIKSFQWKYDYDGKLSFKNCCKKLFFSLESQIEILIEE